MSASNWDGHPKDPRYSSQRWLKIRKSILAGSPRCELCGHNSPPPRSVDHMIPVELLTTDAEFFERSNLKPMHNHLTPCLVCAVASGGKIQGACNQLKGSSTYDVAKARLKRRTGLEWAETPTRLTTTTRIEIPEEASPARTYPYATIQDAIRDMAPFSESSDDYNLVMSMINDGWACESSCDCGGGISTDGGRCFDAMFDLGQQTI